VSGDSAMTKRLEEALRKLASCDHRNAYSSSGPSGGHGGSMENTQCPDCGGTKGYWGTSFRYPGLVDDVLSAIGADD